MNKLQDRVALVTGSDSGIGQGCATEFAKEGADVVVNYLHDRDGAETTAAEVRKAGRQALVVQGDVGREADVERLFAAATRAFGRVDILVNSAGVDASGTDVAELDIESFESSLRTNLFGPVLCCKHFIRHRRSNGGGSGGNGSIGGKIINITSVHEEIPRAGAADYDCAKGAVRNLTRTLALELAGDGINVNNIAPGMVLTPFNQEAVDDPEVRKQQTESIPLKRAAEPWELGRLAVFLASSDADYVTRASYVMDGGLMQNQGQGA